MSRKQKNEKELKQMWNDFHALRDQKPLDNPEKDKQRLDNLLACRNRLIEAYYYLVQRIAEKMSQRLREVTVDDLSSFGVDGLFQAIDNFKPEMGNKFQTYAVTRIKGSIIDNIRQIDWVPRLVRQRASKIEKARHTLESDLGRKPTDLEMATHMKMDLDKFLEFKARAVPVGCSSIYSRTNEEGDGTETEIMDICSKDEDPLRHIVKDEFFKKVMGKGFTRIERDIIALHYYDGMTMKEIADSKGFSESRISQMHAEIMRRLELKMERIPNYISDIEEAIS